ncbi:MAG: hypothetical protein H0Z39_03630 [Peptococcaceae bacterium]|nr:hypothetical protein [Peptococcaceae bacterium]
MIGTRIVQKPGLQSRSILAISPRLRKGFIYYSRTREVDFTRSFTDQDRCFFCGANNDTVSFKGKMVCLDCIYSLYRDSLTK